MFIYCFMAFCGYICRKNRSFIVFFGLLVLNAVKMARNIGGCLAPTWKHCDLFGTKGGFGHKHWCVFGPAGGFSVYLAKDRNKQSLFALLINMNVFKG
jgi:hypothetical protein